MKFRPTTRFGNAAALSLIAGATGLFLAAATARAGDGTAPPPANKTGATTIEYGKGAPGDKATIFDDGIKPVAPKANSQGTIYDDSIKPANPAAVPKATIYDDGIKPVKPGTTQGTVYDDTVKPAPK